MVERDREVGRVLDLLEGSPRVLLVGAPLGLAERWAAGPRSPSTPLAVAGSARGLPARRWFWRLGWQHVGSSETTGASAQSPSGDARSVMCRGPRRRTQAIRDDRPWLSQADG